VGEPIAIVGMACIFPGAPTLQAYWDNIVSARDAVTSVPAHRLDRRLYGEAGEVASFQCWRGGFVDEHAVFSPLDYGIMPVAARQAEPDQLLALRVADAALRDTGLGAESLPRSRTGVILGKGNYAGAAQLRLQHRLKGGAQLVQALEDLLPSVSPQELARVKRELLDQLDAPRADGMIGVVPNLTASRIASHHDFGGAAYTVDAACASSLLAVEHACRELNTGNADMMLCGGVHMSPLEVFWGVFTGLGALSKSEQIRPFDARADGLLIGEGIGILVLRRLEDALGAGQRVYAVIQGAGSSSDGRGTSLMSPNVEGQVAAVENAWTRSGLDPADVGLLEAHGTGTPTGDAAEVETMRRCFGERRGAPTAVVGSVKSMIGHAMPAAGAAGLIKAAMAVHHRLLPPTLHCERPREDLASTRFAPIEGARPWSDDRRLAAVSAFGFGGVNAHLVLTAPPRSRVRARTSSPTAAAPEPLRIGARDVSELLTRLDHGEAGGEGPVRLALVDPTPERMAKVRRLVEQQRPLSGRLGFYFAPEQGQLGRGGKLALLFPGFDAHFQPRIDDVAEHFELVLPSLRADRSLEDWGTAITRINLLLHAALAELGVQADVVAGHSVGEWSAMVAAGILTPDELHGAMGRVQPGTVPLPDVHVTAVPAAAERVRTLLASLPALEISHDNCPHQTIVCGPPSAMETAREQLASAGLTCRRLPFDGGVHSSHYAAFAETHRAAVEQMRVSPARVPAYSATTCAIYPSEPAAVRALWVEHLFKPVRFRELVEELYAQGVRVFVEVGTGSLVSFVEDTLRGRPHAAIRSNTPNRAGLEELTRAACALWVEGLEIDFSRLCHAESGATAAPQTPGLSLALSLGVPLARFERPLATWGPPSEPPRDQTSDPLLTMLDDNLRHLAEAQQNVAAAAAHRWSPATKSAPPESRPRPRHALPPPTRVRRLGLDTLPELIDHAFYRQREGWPHVADLRPVVPLTALIEVMAEVARQLSPGRLVVGMERIWARRWLDVPEPLDVPIHHRALDDTRLEVRVGDYTQAIVELGAGYPRPPDLTALDRCELGPAPMQAADVYDEHWMFHGPAYQGIQRLDGISPTGIQGTLRCGPALGALLDNAGQLFGLWIATQTQHDRLAMPTRVRRIQFHGPQPPPGTQVACRVHIGEMKPRSGRCDFTLTAHGQRWVTVTGWQDARFPVQGRLWDVALWPERHTLAEPRDAATVVLADDFEGMALLDYLEGRYLRRSEREGLRGLSPRARRHALLERVAAKDAVRHFLWRGKQGDTFPAEVTLRHVAAGHYEVTQPATLTVRTEQQTGSVQARVELPPEARS